MGEYRAREFVKLAERNRLPPQRMPGDSAGFNAREERQVSHLFSRQNGRTGLLRCGSKNLLLVFRQASPGLDLVFERLRISVREGDDIESLK